MPGGTAGQLESELEEEAWFVVEALESELFTPEPGTLWRDVLRRQPGKSGDVCVRPGGPDGELIDRDRGRREPARMTDRISWFPIAERETLSGETNALFDQIEEKLGFVPNVFLAFAWREGRMSKWWAHFDDLMQGSPGLGRAEREMISVVVSMQNQCLYCLTSHGFAVRALLKDP